MQTSLDYTSAKKNKIGYDPSATSAKCRLCQCYCSRQLKVRLGGSWVEPLPISEKTRMQVRLHSNLDGSSLAHAIQVPMGPLHYFRIILELERERTKEEKEREEVLHLFRCYTHTPGRSQVNPERQKEEKSGHTKGKRPRTAQGGEGEQTDLRNQPTRRNGLEQNSAHT